MYNTVTGTQGAQTPHTDTHCDLIASMNVFGRLLYGVSPDRVCTDNARISDVNGIFVHIEQKPPQRDQWSVWSEVMRRSFG